MKWRKPEQAALRIETLTSQELRDNNVDLEIATAWRECYCKEYIRTNFLNVNALHRAALMDRAVELLGGPSTIEEYLHGVMGFQE